MHGTLVLDYVSAVAKLILPPLAVADTWQCWSRGVICRLLVVALVHRETDTPPKVVIHVSIWTVERGQ